MSEKTLSATAMGVAVRCWAEPASEHCVMQPEVAIVFARKVECYHDLIESAWGIIANADNWVTSSAWRDAAAEWREHYHAMLDSDLAKATT